MAKIQVSGIINAPVESYAGSEVGDFPVGWSEWNGRYRDTVRDFWRGEDRTLAEFASRLSGSADLYESSGRTPGDSRRSSDRRTTPCPAASSTPMSSESNS